MSTTRTPDRLDIVVVVAVPALAALVGIAGGAVSAFGGCLAFLVGSVAGTAALRIPVGIPGDSPTPSVAPAPVAPPSSAPVTVARHALVVAEHAGPNGRASVAPGARIVEMAKLGAAAAQSDDAVAVSPDGRRIAVADGASSAFAAGLWARGLVDSAVAGAPVFDAGARAAWLGACAEFWRSGTSDTGGWWDDEARARGSFAALVVVDLDERGQFRAIAVGDCCVIVVEPDGGTVVTSFPLASAGQFGTTPPLIGVEPSTWGGWEETVGDIPASGVAVVASDAAAQWLLSDPSRVSLLLAASGDEVMTILDGERRSGRMVNDDISIVLIDRRSA